MRPEVGPIGKGLAAVSATVGLFSGVGAEVALQQPRPREGFPANAALVAQVVGEEVHGEGRHGDVDLVTLRAFLGPVRVEVAVSLLVSRQIG